MAAVWALIVDRGEILLTQRAATTSRPLQWCPPGGRVKNGESGVDACVREVREETGLSVRIVAELAAISDSIYYLCKLTCQRQIQALANRECHDARWCRPDEMLQLGDIMDLAKLIPLLRLAGLPAPPVPDGLALVSLEQRVESATRRTAPSPR